MLQVADLSFNLDTLTVARGGKAIQLNPIGLKLLHILMESSPSVVTRRTEHRVWGEELPDSDSPARAHPRSARGDRQALRQAPLIQTGTASVTAWWIRMRRRSSARGHGMPAGLRRP